MALGRKGLLKKGKFKKKRKMSHETQEKNIWSNYKNYNKTSSKGFLRQTLTFAAAFPALKCFDTSLASQELHFPEIKDLVTLADLTVVVKKKKKKTSALTLILMNQLTWPLIDFLFLK